MSSQRKSADLEALEREIARAHRIVGSVIVVAISAYLVWFWFIHSRSVSQEADAWGQFGDYIGGLLNPLVAYAAFYWLTRSVRLQKEELYETRIALSEATEAQQSQASLARLSVRLTALSTLTASITAEVEMQRLQLHFLVDQLSSNLGSGRGHLLDGSRVELKEIRDQIGTVNARIEKRMTERYEYEQQIRGLLSKFDADA